MSTAINISRGHVATRLVGDPDIAAKLERHLASLLRQEVLPRVAEALAPDLAEEAVICLPDLPLHLSLTLEEALSGQAAEKWSSALIEHIRNRVRDRQDIWQYDNRWGFLAGYLRHRLDLPGAPKAVFTGLGVMELMSPAQALGEGLREWPEIWPYLAPDGAEDVAGVIAAMRRSGGMTLFDQIMQAAWVSEGRTAPGAPFSGTSLRTVFAALSDGAVPDLRRLAQADTCETLSIKAFRFALALAPHNAMVSPAHLGLIIVLLQEVSAQVGPSDMHDQLWPVLEDMADALPQGPAREAALTLMPLMRRDPDMVRYLRILANQLSSAPSARPKHQDMAVDNPAPPADRKDTPTRSAEPAARVFHSPIAGMALCLPLLNESRIGVEFCARDRLAALSELARDGPVAQPEEDALLRAICGQEKDHPAPERPNPMDLLFVPEEWHAAILSTPFGPARLALWLEARFAASLPGLDQSTRDFLRVHFFHQPGRAALSATHLRVEIDAMPLRPVLEMSGLLGQDRGRLAWLDNQSFTLRVRDGARP